MQKKTKTGNTADIHTFYLTFLGYLFIWIQINFTKLG